MKESGFHANWEHWRTPFARARVAELERLAKLNVVRVDTFKHRTQYRVMLPTTAEHGRYVDYFPHRGRWFDPKRETKGKGLMQAIAYLRTP